MTLPEPYYDRDGITIYHADCRDVLPLLPEKSIDLVLTDPPYGETSLTWDDAVSGWTDLLEPLLTVGASMWCFGSLRFFMEQREQFKRWTHAQEIVWEKHNGSIFHADRFRRVHELAAQFYRGKWDDVYKSPQFTMDATKRTVRRKGRPAHSGHIDASSYASEDGGPRMMRSVQFVRSCHGYAVHPTQKPEGIVRPLLSYSCRPGGTVLDPFMGSGTTLAVAMQEGRKAIGIDNQEDNCRKAVNRLSQAVLPL